MTGRFAGLALAAVALCGLAAPEAGAGVVIDEIHYHPIQGKALEFIELHNTGPDRVDLGGWAFRRGVRHEFEPGTAIEPGAYLVLCQDPRSLALEFGLDAGMLIGWRFSTLSDGGETLTLVDAEERVVEEVEYDDEPPWADLADGGGPSLQRLCFEGGASNPANWVAPRDVDPTPLAPNSAAGCPPPDLPAPRVAINEIYYHPLSGREEEEFIELVNTTNLPVDLEGYRFSTGVSFTFDAGTTIEAGGFLVVAHDAETLTSRFEVPGPVVGNWEGRLSDDGERITLLDGSGRLVDSVRYDDSGDWGVAPDGLGSSLEKIVATAVSDDPASWRDSRSGGAGGWESETLSGTGTSDTFLMYANGEAEFYIDDVRLVDVNAPETDLLPSFGFDTGIEGWEARGNHSDSGWISDGGEDGGGALWLVAAGRGSGSSNSVRATTLTSIDRSGDTTYRLSFSFRHISGLRGLTVRLSGSTRSRGIFFQLGSGVAMTPGASNRAGADALPPFVSHVRRFPQEPGSEDPVFITADVRSEGVTRVVLEVSPGKPGAEVFEMLDDGLARDGLAGDGTWGIELPPRPHDTAVTYRIEATGPTGSRLFPPESDPTGVFGYYVSDDRPDSPLPVYTLILGPELGPDPRTAIARLNCTTYRNASFAFQGDLWFNIGIRRRGQSVCGDPDVIKKFIKLKFQRGREFRGLRKLNLQSLWTDKSLVREHLAWEAFDEIGNPYCFHHFVRLHAGGRYFGLYAELEHPDQRFLARNGLDPAGNLYKAVASREERTGSRASVQQSYEKKTNEDGDFSDLAEFLAALHSTPRAKLTEFFQSRVDQDAMIDYQAAQVLTNNRDYPHKNHYLYHDPESDRWMPITWDMDLSFGKRWDGNFEGVLNDLMDNPGITPWYTTNVRGGGTGNHLLDKFFSQAGTWFRRAYLVRLQGALREKYTRELYEEKLAKLHDLLLDEQAEDIAAWGRSRPSANDRSAPAEFEPNLDRVRQHIRVRRNFLVNYLRSTERFPDHDWLKITELMYNPVGPSEDGEFLELWNGTGREIDVSGWSIVGIGALDLEGNPLEFVFPQGTALADDALVIVAKDPLAFDRLYGDPGVRVFGPYPGQLSNSGETLRVRDAGPGYPATVDFLRYGTGGDWSSRADGLGFSLELTGVSAERDNDLAGNWRSSLLPGGTPGRIARPGEDVRFTRGDCNGDRSTNISDAIALLLYLFRGGRTPPCLDACDVDGDESLGISDPIWLLNWLYRPDTPPPPSPGPGECLPARDGFCEASNCDA